MSDDRHAQSAARLLGTLAQIADAFNRAVQDRREWRAEVSRIPLVDGAFDLKTDGYDIVIRIDPRAPQGDAARKGPGQ